jgi:hypothetical protein
LLEINEQHRLIWPLTKERQNGVEFVVYFGCILC